MTMRIEYGPWLRSAALIVLIANLSGCAWISFGSAGSVPDEPGLYAVYGDELQRLDGDREWELETWEERSNLPRETEFLIRHPKLPPPDQLEGAVFLSRVAWIRSEISPEGDILPVDGPRWVAAEGVEELRVPVRLEPHPDDAEVVRVVPGARLQRGLYTLQLRTRSARRSARAGIEWSAADRRTFSAANCVDRYLGDAVPYRRCAEQLHAFASKWLKVHLVEPEVRAIAGQPKQLIVSGVVINTSERPRRVPTLEARLRSGQGEVVKRWQFETSTTELQPGASARFRSALPNPPTGISNVHVTFAEPGPGPADRPSP